MLAHLASPAERTNVNNGSSARASNGSASPYWRTTPSMVPSGPCPQAKVTAEQHHPVPFAPKMPNVIQFA